MPPPGSPSYVFSRAYIAIRFLLLFGFRISVSQCAREGERERTAETKPKPEFLQPRLPENRKRKTCALIGRWRCCRESRGFCSSRERGGKDKIRRVGKTFPSPFSHAATGRPFSSGIVLLFSHPISPSDRPYVQRRLHSNKCARSTDFSPCHYLSLV